MTIQTWALFCATEAVLSFIPGPAVLYVVSSSIAHGSRAGVVASLSILAANAFYFTIGPDKQLDAWDAYLGGKKLVKLYPRDFWMP